MSLSGSKLWTIGSGKGGVGRSFLTATMGTALAGAGKSVIVADANLAAPHLHAWLGIKAPSLTLLDVLERNSAAADALMPTAQPQMRFLSCVGTELGMADLAPAEHQKISELLLRLDADYVLVDVGSGGTLSVLDFFNLADEAIVVASPDQSSMQCAYGFIKNSIYRKVQRRFGSHEGVSTALRQLREGAGAAKSRTMTDFLDILRPLDADAAETIATMVDGHRPHILVNMTVSEQDRRMAEIIQSAVKKFLNFELRSCGLVQFDLSVRKAAQRMSLSDFSEPDCVAARQIQQITCRLAGCQTSLEESERGQPRSILSPALSTGLNDNLTLMGRELHIQTEDSGETERCITTQVFCDGRVILSTKSDYQSLSQDSLNGDRVVELMRAQHFNVIREIEDSQTRLHPALV